MQTYILVDAGPGTGKSLTLEHAYRYLLSGVYSFTPTQEQVNICHFIRETCLSTLGPVSPANCCFVMYNDSTKTAMKAKLSNQTKVFTFHGLGMSILTKRHGAHRRDDYRGQKMLASLLGKPLNHFPYNERLQYYSLLKYVEACKEELLIPSQDAFIKIHEKYSFPPPPENVDLAVNLLSAMRTNTNTFEFIDQVWLGLQKLQTPIYKVLFVDEAQDISALRLELALKVAEMVVFCGDPFQGINAFAGADVEAWNTLTKICKYTLPLKTSFRLPPNHIEHANKIRPARITAFKDAPGPIHNISLKDLPVILNTYLSSPPVAIPLHNGPTTPDFSKLLPPPPQPQVYNHHHNQPYNPLIADSLQRPPQPALDNILKPPPHAHALPDPSAIPVPPSSSPSSILCPVPSSIFPADPSSHLMIARTNAQCFRVGIHLLKNRIPVCILKRKDSNQDISKVLIDYFLKTSQNRTPAQYDKFLLEEIRRSKSLSYNQRIHLEEKTRCIQQLLQEVETMDQIPTLITNLTAERESAVRISTIHKAKGMEAPFVYILFPPIHHPSAQSPIELEQEKNLEFVSETRSLFFKAYVKE